MTLGCPYLFSFKNRLLVEFQKTSQLLFAILLYFHTHTATTQCSAFCCVVQEECPALLINPYPSDIAVFFQCPRTSNCIQSSALPCLILPTRAVWLAGNNLLQLLYIMILFYYYFFLYGTCGGVSGSFLTDDFYIVLTLVLASMTLVTRCNL